MKTKITTWKLAAGDGVGQETAEYKRKKGEEYIAKLKSDGEEIISVEERDNCFVITMKDV